MFDYGERGCMSGGIATVGAGFFGADTIVARPKVAKIDAVFARGAGLDESLKVEVDVGSNHEAVYVITAIHAVDKRSCGATVVAGEVRDESGSYHHFILYCYGEDDADGRDEPLRGCFNVM